MRKFRQGLRTLKACGLLLQRDLELHPLGNVFGDARRPVDLALRVANGESAVVDPA
jgi:hypothetical protein